MSEQILPGDGWRLLGPDEVIRDGDEPWHRFEQRWTRFAMEVPCTAKAYPAVRRRIPAKPEAIKIRHTLIKCNSFNDVMRATNQDVSLLVGSAAEARQLADWLNRFADWREAQDEAK
jgi:hypothetical protein